MYKTQLIGKYLVKRRIAWVALVAVMLCTAMVLIVISVMGGWLATFKSTFHSITGDVIVNENSVTGFPYYEDMIGQIKKLPGVVAAVPVIKTGAILNLNGQETHYVQVTAYPPDIGDVLPWVSTLARQGKQKRPSFGLLDDVPYEEYVNYKVRDSARSRAGIIVSSPIVGLTHDRSDKVQKNIRRNMLTAPVSLTMLPMAGGENADLEKAIVIPCWIVDDSKSKVWQLDNNTVYLAFDEAQKDLKMSAAVDTEGFKIPARCSEIDIKTAPGADLNEIKSQVEEITEKVARDNKVPTFYGTNVKTWDQLPQTFISAVETEVTLMTVLFGIISSVAVLLIFCIFYMIVLEKTKDIGILKSVGASSTGILALFLGYGLAIGVVGAGLGLTVAYLVCHFINQINDFVGRHSASGKAPFNAETYQFDTLPSTMETRTVIYVVCVAILSALIGSLLPALRAATMNPIDALRYE